MFKLHLALSIVMSSRGLTVLLSLSFLTFIYLNYILRVCVCSRSGGETFPRHGPEVGAALTSTANTEGLGLVGVSAANTRFFFLFICSGVLYCNLPRDRGNRLLLPHRDERSTRLHGEQKNRKNSQINNSRIRFRKYLLMMESPFFFFFLLSWNKCPPLHVLAKKNEHQALGSFSFSDSFYFSLSLKCPNKTWLKGTGEKKERLCTYWCWKLVFF